MRTDIPNGKKPLTTASGILRSTFSPIRGKTDLRGSVSFVAPGVREFGRRHRGTEKEPKTENQDDELARHRHHQSHHIDDVGGRYPARLCGRGGLNDGNTGLWRTEEIEKQLQNLKQHHQHRQHDAKYASSHAGPGHTLYCEFSRAL